jgi:hypothetical protein
VEREGFINVRKLAAFDLYFRGSRFILVEFAFGVFGLGALGFLSVFLGLTKSALATGIGLYLLLLGVDYVPLLVYGIGIARKGSAKREVEAELADEAYFRKKYGVQQTLLMVPLFIPSLALSQELRKRRVARDRTAPSHADS